MTDPLYITTPIYYVNDRPHLGTAYTTVVADVMARYARLRGRDVRFVTGTDEHGQKIERKAAERGVHPQALADEVAAGFRSTWRTLTIQYDAFVRTTSPEHADLVGALWERCRHAGDIYLGEYEGWYCVADEAFYTDKEVENGVAPTGRICERVREPSYFFRLSRYAEALLRHYDDNPGFVQPQGRLNEIRRFVEGGLTDLSISRTGLRWGVPVPNDTDHVVYVWFDALASYLHAWPPGAEVLHLVGKDILRFHAVYWPAFLKSAGLPLPKTIFAHGWLTVDKRKISKSEGGLLPPEPIAEVVGSDALRFYLIREIGLGHDGDFSHAAVLARQRDLANGLGNLLHRFTKTLVPSSFDGRVPPFADPQPADLALARFAEQTASLAGERFEALAPHRGLDAIWQLVVAANRYVDEAAPWALVKDPAKRDRLATVTYAALETLRWLSVLLAPVLPDSCDELRARLGLERLVGRPGQDAWTGGFGQLSPGTRVTSGPPLFPRIDEDAARTILARLAPPSRIDA